MHANRMVIMAKAEVQVAKISILPDDGSNEKSIVSLWFGFFKLHVSSVECVVRTVRILLLVDF